MRCWTQFKYGDKKFNFSSKGSTTLFFENKMSKITFKSIIFFIVQEANNIYYNFLGIFSF